MRPATLRTVAPLAAAAALAGVAACSFEELTPNVIVSVTQVPADADHLDVLLTDSALRTYQRKPAFGLGQFDGSALELAFKVESLGAFNVQLTALNHDGTVLASGSVSSTVGATPVTVAAALTSSGLDGTFGRPCLPSGSAVECSGTGLVCKRYTATDKGVCTLACGAVSCPSSPTPASACIAFPGGAGNFCQWDCTSAGCPSGLTCGAAISGKKYCQGSVP